MIGFAQVPASPAYPTPRTREAGHSIGTLVMARSARLALMAACLFGFLLAPQTARAETITFPVGGQQRSFVLERPRADGPLPTIILLHGLGGNAEALANASGLGRLGARENFVAVFPDGINHAWNHFPPGTAPQRYIDLLASRGDTPPDDVAFLRQVVTGLVGKGISDPKRIYLAGISAGGFMTLRMSCLDAPMFAAIALIISGMPDATGAQCHPTKPLPVVMIKGDADPNVPWDGGFVRVHTFTVWPQERLFAFFRQLDGCADTADRSELPNQGPRRVEFVRWTSCTNDGPVEVYRVIDGVHAIPQSPPVTPTLWAFFRDKSR